MFSPGHPITGDIVFYRFTLLIAFSLLANQLPRKQLLRTEVIIAMLNPILASIIASGAIQHQNYMCWPDDKKSIDFYICLNIEEVFFFCLQVFIMEHEELFMVMLREGEKMYT